MNELMSRRDLILGSAAYGGSLWVLLNLPRPRALRAAQESTRPEVLDEAQWKTVEAITARIIPTDHQPGAIEANCVNFIDKTLAHEDEKMKPVYVHGLAALGAVTQQRFGKPFVALAPEQQDEILAAVESGTAAGWPAGGVPSPDFFALVRTHTIIGFLADPKYGGNQGYAGWKVVGYPGGGHHQGGYSPGQMMGKEKIKTVWGEDV